jgi:hypothetical protein
MTWRMSDGLIVRRSREGRRHGGAASRDGCVLGQHELHAVGGDGLLGQEKRHQSWQRDLNA